MSYFMRKGKKKEEGFTLIELVIVIAIIGILMAIAIPNYMRAREAAAAGATKANLRNLATALELYMAEENRSAYPDPDGGDNINEILEAYFNGPAPVPPGATTESSNYLYAKTTDGFLISDPNPYGGVVYGVGPGGSIQEVSEPTGTPISF